MSLRNIKLCLTFRECWNIVFQMKAYKLKSFNRFARYERIPDQSLRDALEDVVGGRAAANLGGNVYKVRVAREGAGKSGGFRVLLCLQLGDRAFFLMGFAKSSLENISQTDLVALKRQAEILLSLRDDVIAGMLRDGSLEELEVLP